MPSGTSSLTPEKALVFRITHRDNVPWILDRGLYCSTAPVQDPNFITIGSREIIAKRCRRSVPLPPGGTLAEYVPFYFTPLSPMLLNIKTGRHGVRQRPMGEIVILVSSLHRFAEHRLPFVFTDRHAIYTATNFFSDLSELSQVPWSLLQARDFARDPEDPGKVERYQAEALVHQHVPTTALLGVVCYNDGVADDIIGETTRRGLELKVTAYQGWFF
jgi:hypothetical protein